jgi:hypothetical protein
MRALVVDSSAPNAMRMAGAPEPTAGQTRALIEVGERVLGLAGGGRIAWFQDPDGNTFAIEADA